MKRKQVAKLPTVTEMMDQLMTPGTELGQLEFQDKPIIFKNTPQSVVKKLSVRVKSTESIDTATLHKLHTQTRLI